MKKLIFAFILCFISVCGFSQAVPQVTIPGSTPTNMMLSKGQLTTNSQFTAYPAIGDSSYFFVGHGGDGVSGMSSLIGYPGRWLFYNELSGGNNDNWEDYMSIDLLSTYTLNSYNSPDYGIGQEMFLSQALPIYQINPRSRFSGGDTPVVRAITTTNFMNYQTLFNPASGFQIGVLKGIYSGGTHGAYGPGSMFDQNTALSPIVNDYYIDTTGAYRGRAYIPADTIQFIKPDATGLFGLSHIFSTDIITAYTNFASGTSITLVPGYNIVDNSTITGAIFPAGTYDGEVIEIKIVVTGVTTLTLTGSSATPVPVLSQGSYDKWVWSVAGSKWN
jgi:hypothetical protein